MSRFSHISRLTCRDPGNRPLLKAWLGCVLILATLEASAARDSVSIVGSSTVFPFAKVVAERFGKATRFKSPTVESTGTGGGFKQFCGGLGIQYPDIVNASRPIKDKEMASCREHGVLDVVEIPIGYDGIVLANSVHGRKVSLSRREIFLALAKQVPGGEGVLVDNPHQTWADVNPRLPGEKIEIYGPPSTSGTRDAFLELAMQGGCESFAWVKALQQSEPLRFRQICQIIREDGVFRVVGENDNLIVQKLRANKNAIGLLGFSFLDQNWDLVQPATIEGVMPSFASISEGHYPVSRPLFLYVKRAHIGYIPGLKQYVAEFTSEKSWGEEGYLIDKGMIPLLPQQRAQISEKVQALSAKQ